MVARQIIMNMLFLDGPLSTADSQKMFQANAEQYVGWLTQGTGYPFGSSARAINPQASR